MSTLKFGSGGVRVEMSDTLDRIFRNSIEHAQPGLLGQIERATREVFDRAVASWPVRTGKSKAGLEHRVTVDAEMTSVSGTVVNTVDYSRYIKSPQIGGKSALVALLRKPMQTKAKALVDTLATQITRDLTRGS